MQLLVMNLTDFQNLKFNVFVAQETLLFIEDSIQDIIGVHNIEARQNNVTIIFKKGWDLPHEVITDSGRVTQVLENVVRQAIRMAYRDSEVEIDCWTDMEKLGKGRLFFSVTLSCEAISEEDKSLMFEQQLESKIKKSN